MRAVSHLVVVRPREKSIQEMEADGEHEGDAIDCMTEDEILAHGCMKAMVHLYPDDRTQEEKDISAKEINKLRFLGHETQKKLDGSTDPETVFAEIVGECEEEGEKDENLATYLM